MLMSEVVSKLMEGPIAKKNLPAAKRLQSEIGPFESRSLDSMFRTENLSNSQS